MLSRSLLLSLFFIFLAGSSPARAHLDPRHLYEFNRELARSLAGRPGPGSLLPAAVTGAPWFREAKAALRKAGGTVRLAAEEDSLCLLSTAGRICWLPALKTGGLGIRFRGIERTFFPPAEPNLALYRTALAKFLREARGSGTTPPPPAPAEEAALAESLPAYFVHAILAADQSWHSIAGAHDEKTGSPVRFADAAALLTDRGRGKLSRAEVRCEPAGTLVQMRNEGGEFSLRDVSPNASHSFDGKDFLILSRESARYRVRVEPSRARQECKDAFTGESRGFCELPFPRETFVLVKCGDEACATTSPATPAEKTALAGPGKGAQEARLLDLVEDFIDARVAALCCRNEPCRKAIDDLVPKR